MMYVRTYKSATQQKLNQGAVAGYPNILIHLQMKIKEKDEKPAKPLLLFSHSMSLCFLISDKTGAFYPVAGALSTKKADCC